MKYVWRAFNARPLGMPIPPNWLLSSSFVRVYSSRLRNSECGSSSASIPARALRVSSSYAVLSDAST